MFRIPPFPINVERVPAKLIRAYKSVREPPAPDRRRLGMSNAEVEQSLRPSRSFLVGACGLGPVWKHRPGLDEVVDGRMRDLRFIEINEGEQ